MSRFAGVLRLEKVTIDSIDYQLQGLPMGEFHAGVGEARLNGMDVGLEKQTVELEKIMLLRGFCDLLMAESTGEQSGAGVATEESRPWQVRVGTVELEDNRFLMKPMSVPVDAEQFPETIRISALSLKVDSVFNKGTGGGGNCSKFTFQGRKWIRFERFVLSGQFGK